MIDAVLQSLRLPELLASRTTASAHDDTAAIVLGPRLRDVLAALAIPERDWLRVSRRLDDGDREALGGYVDVLVADRCRLPGEDVISDLVAHEVDGRGLTAEEIRAIVVGCVSRCRPSRA